MGRPSFMMYTNFEEQNKIGRIGEQTVMNKL